MNPFTTDALREALKHDKKLFSRKYAEIRNAALSYYHEALWVIGHQFWLRAVLLFYQFRPACVGLDGLEDGYVECDECSQHLTDSVQHFLYTWWVEEHPEYRWDDFDEGEARAVLEATQAEKEAARLAKTDYQIAMF